MNLNINSKIIIINNILNKLFNLEIFDYISLLKIMNINNIK